MNELPNYLTQKSTRPACGAGKFIQADGHLDGQRAVVFHRLIVSSGPKPDSQTTASFCSSA